MVELGGLRILGYLFPVLPVSCTKIYIGNRMGLGRPDIPVAAKVLNTSFRNKESCSIWLIPVVTVEWLCDTMIVKEHLAAGRATTVVIKEHQFSCNE